MGLHDDLDALSQKTVFPAKQCRVGFLYTCVDGEELRVLQNLIEESHVAATEISDVLRRHGYDVSYSSILRHRKRKVGGGCLCP